MSTQKEKEEVKETAAQPAKKLRRGINNETRATSRLKFDERRDANRTNGLFVGHLDNVEIKWITIGEDVQGVPQFAGQSIPLLSLMFASNHEDVMQRRYVEHRIMPAESNALTIPGGKDAWKVESIFSWMKHVLNTFMLKNRPMTEEEEDALTLPFSDFDENNQYIPVEPEEVIAGWKVVFENFVNMINNNGKPYYKNDKGGIIPIWMKLLRFVKDKNEWKAVVRNKSNFGDLGFPSFVGEGCIELYKQDAAPLIKIDITKESITYKETKKATTPAMPAGAGVVPMGVPMGAAPVATPTPDFGIPQQEQASQVFDASDLPF